MTDTHDRWWRRLRFGPAPACGRRWTRWLGRSWARWTYGRHIEPTWLELTRHQVPLARLPAEFDRFRVVQLSDLHGGRGVSLAYLDEAVELANAQKPDLIAVTGDFIHHGFRYVDRVASLVGRLSAPHGVFAVLGNHDFSVRSALGIRRHRHLHNSIATALTGCGISVLRNRGLTIERGAARLHVAGVDDLWSGACDVRQAFAEHRGEHPCILLAHNPTTVDFLRGRHCDLILSGHTHGGQINWPGLGRFMLSRRARRYAAGMYRVHNSYLYVNRGVGHGFRFRFGVRPEVAVLELRSGQAPPSRNPPRSA